MTEEEIKKELEEFDKHPLFMKEIPENIEDNKYLQALQAIKFEGTPDKIALENLIKSKECFENFNQNKKFESLKESMFYICTAIGHVKDDSTVSDLIKYDLYTFRAQLQFFVKNYGHAINDIKSALFHIDKDEAYIQLNLATYV
jgi:hypothetical protein